MKKKTLFNLMDTLEKPINENLIKYRYFMENKNKFT